MGKSKLPELTYKRIPETDDGMKFELLTQFTYYSKRYDKNVTVKSGMLSDGASGAFDIYSWGWWIHDQLCNTGKFDDGSPCTNWQASTVIKDILFAEKRYFRSMYWWAATWLFGGDKARKNGLI